MSTVAKGAGAIELRRANADDLPAVEALLSASGLPTQGVASRIRDFIIAEHDGHAIGAIGLESYGSHGLLRSAVVAKEWQGKGVGRSLVERLLQETQLRGISSVYLLTTTAEDYFPSFGFSRVDRSAVPDELMESAEFQGACPASATVMHRSAREVSRPQ